ncbi:hypothetical protein BpHYR1_046664 [Brachionus plicatilis]|uniref:Uncharacterized protein n=1 Tax=Brachionus plicatilis TaxID=10195 RepID=A0A3M7RVC7_BRAPC|nr:hypothetical protein BpHYR1_046664 [Brachionus plicatilis]
MTPRGPRFIHPVQYSPSLPITFPLSLGTTPDFLSNGISLSILTFLYPILLTSKPHDITSTCFSESSTIGIELNFSSESKSWSKLFKSNLDLFVIISQYFQWGPED